MAGRGARPPLLPHRSEAQAAEKFSSPREAAAFRSPPVFMSKPSRYWICTACGETVVNQPMVVLKHQMSHARRRPLAGVRSLWERKEERDAVREGRWHLKSELAQWRQCRQETAFARWLTNIWRSRQNRATELPATSAALNISATGVTSSSGGLETEIQRSPFGQFLQGAQLFTAPPGLASACLLRLRR